MPFCLNVCLSIGVSSGSQEQGFKFTPKPYYVGSDEKPINLLVNILKICQVNEVIIKN